jgi:hypothetical protein
MSIDHQPVQSNRLDGLAKLIEIDRLLYVTVGAQAEGLPDVPIFPGRGQDHYWDGSGSRIGLNLLEHLDAVDFRKFQIQQNQDGRTVKRPERMGASAKEKIQSFFTVAGNVDFVREFSTPQRVHRQFGVIAAVFHQKNFGLG